MDDLVLKFEDEELPRARVALLLEHFSKLSDEREPRRVMYPLNKMGNPSALPGNPHSLTIPAPFRLNDQQPKKQSRTPISSSVNLGNG